MGSKSKKPVHPRVLIAVNGGVVVGVRSTVPVSVEVWDEDDKEAEGMGSKARNRAFSKVAKDYPVEAY